MDELKGPDGNMDMKAVHRIIKLSSNDMDCYSEILESQVVLSSKSRVEAFDALSKALSFYVDVSEEKDSGIEKLEDGLKFMRDSTTETIRALIGFRGSIENFPRLTMQLNKSKRRVLEVLNTVLEEVYSTIQTTNNALDTVNELKNIH